MFAMYSRQTTGGDRRDERESQSTGREMSRGTHAAGFDNHASPALPAG